MNGRPTTIANRRLCKSGLRRSSTACLLAALSVFATMVSGAELHGTWSAASNGGRTLAGTWTAEAHQESGGVTGAWTLRDASGKILMSGAWSASKSPQAWNGAWRSIVAGGGEYSGTWTSEVSLGRDARLVDMFESALRAVVTGTWKAGSYSGAWSIRASP
jgi:hypothetical protein